jgi:hypothetical protein
VRLVAFVREDLPQLRIRKGRKLFGASLDFGRVAAVRDSFPQFEEAKRLAGRSDLPFQEGVPGDFDLAMFTLGPAAALTHRRAFTEATLSEIRDVAAITGAGTLFRSRSPLSSSSSRNHPQQRDRRWLGCFRSPSPDWLRRRPRAPGSQFTCASAT